MTKTHWSNAVDGEFEDAADWSTGAVPGRHDIMFLDSLGGTPYTVTAGASETVRAARVASTATLSITGGLFTVRGSIQNSGLIDLGGAGAVAGLVVMGAGHLNGGGSLILGDSRSNVIDIRPGRTLDNVFSNIDNTISGAGVIRGGGILENDLFGVVDATGAHALTLRFSDLIDNVGLIEATGSGGLTFLHTDVVNHNGVVAAGDGSKVRLRGGEIVQGTLRSTGSGKFLVYDARLSVLDNQATVLVRRGFLEMAADNNAGVIEMAASDRRGGLSVLNFLTLTGGGSIRLHRGNVVKASAPGAKLTNVDNTISGAGLIGAGGLILVNQAGGVIDASGSRGLTLDTGARRIANAGTIEATGAGRGTIVSAVDNTGVLKAAGGHLTVNGAVTGAGSGVISGGTLAFGASFAEDVAFSGASGVLALAQSQGYAGQISGFSKADGTSLDLRDIAFTGAGEASYSGTASSGMLTVSDGAHTAHVTLVGAYTGVTFTAADDGQGGVSITDGAPGAPSPHRLAAAMAAMASSGAAAPAAHDARPEAWRPILCASGRAHFA